MSIVLSTVIGFIGQASAISQQTPEPVTLPLLRLAPDSAMLTLAIPSVTKLMETARAVVALAAPPDFSCRETERSMAQLLAERLGQPPCDSIVDLWHAAGLDPDAPCAVYIDLSPLAESLGGAVGQTDTGVSPNAHSSETRPDVELLFAFPFVDAVRAEESLKTLLSGAAETTEGISSGDSVIRKELSWLFVGNSLRLIEDAMTKTRVPATVRYGSDDCPAFAQDDIVMLTQVDRIMRTVSNYAPVLRELWPSAGEHVEQQQQILLSTAGMLAGDEPLVLTLTFLEGSIELHARTNLVSHAALAQPPSSGEGYRLARCMVGDYAVAGWFQGTAALRSAVHDFFSFTPPDDKEPNAMVVQRIFSDLGDELAFECAVDSERLSIVVLMDCKKIDEMRAIFSLSEKIVDAECELYRQGGYGLWSGIAGSTALFSNDRDALCAMCKSLNTNPGHSPFPDAGISSDGANVLGFVRCRFPGASDVIRQLYDTDRGSRWRVPAIIARMGGHFSEIRAGAIQRGTWQDLFVCGLPAESSTR